MLSLNEVNEKIGALQQLSAVDMEHATSGMFLLFLGLMKLDSFYIVSRSAAVDPFIKKNFLPYIAPVSETDTLQFLRIFSHQEAAENFVAGLGEKHFVCQVNTVEAILLAKYWFLLGVDGYMLNDGESWTTVLFLQFLSLFFLEILDDPERVDESYQEVALFCRARCKAPEAQCYVQKKQVKGNSVFFFTDEPSDQSISRSWFEIVSEIGQKKDGSRVVWKREEIVFDVSIDFFMSVLDEVNVVYNALAKDGLTPVYNGFEMSIDTEFDFYSVNPNLAITKEPIPVQKKQKENQEESSVGTKEVKPRVQFHLPKIDIPKIQFKRRSKKLIGLLVGVVVAIIVVVCFYDFGRTNFILADFSEKLSSRDYSGAVSIYERHKSNNMFVDKADDKANQEVDKIITDYAAENRTYEESKAALQTLAIESGFNEHIAIAQKDLDEIRISKDAYVSGGNSTQVIVRLKEWIKVIPKDTKSWEAAQNNFKTNYDPYLQASLNIVDTLIQGNCLQQAADALKVLQYWYPEEKLVSEKVDKLAEESVFLPLSPTTDDITEVVTNPIKITDMSVTYPDFDNAIDLYINWTNTSQKTIQEIDFYVYPQDEVGKEQTNTVGDHYSLYCARDVGPYAPGKGTPTGDWKWDNAWFNYAITKVALKQVVILYTDGTSESIEDGARLQSFFGK